LHFLMWRFALLRIRNAVDKEKGEREREREEREKERARAGE